MSAASIVHIRFLNRFRILIRVELYILVLAKFYVAIDVYLMKHVSGHFLNIHCRLLVFLLCDSLILDCYVFLNLRVALEN